MKIKEFESSYTYDSDLDIIDIEIKDSYSHKETIELGFGVFLDFDVNLLPVNLEILSASQIVRGKKEELLNPDGNVNILIGKDTVEVEVQFKFSSGCESIQLTALNELGFPNSQTSFALI